VAEDRPMNPPDNSELPYLSVNGGLASTDDHESISSSSTKGHPKPEYWEKKPESDGTSADNVDALLPWVANCFTWM